MDMKTVINCGGLMLVVDHTRYEVIKGDSDTPDDFEGEILSITTIDDIQTLLPEKTIDEIIYKILDYYE